MFSDEFNNNKCRRSLPIPVNQNSTTVWGSTHEISEHNLDRISCTSDYNLDSISCTSDYERQSLDFEHHSSEEELEILHKEFVAEKRKRLQPNRHCDSASDEEVKEFMLQPQPINFSSSPPKVVHTQITPVTVMTISSRKRHRQNTTSDSSPMDSSLHRPSLDFEKMQVLMKLHISKFRIMLEVLLLNILKAIVTGASEASLSLFCFNYICIYICSVNICTPSVSS